MKPADLEKHVIKLVEAWFWAEQAKQKSPIGLPNAALQLAEVLRSKYPLMPEDYTSRGGSQVRGLSGRSGDKVIARFVSGMRPLGTESGRTSRGVLPAIRRLAERLNALEDLGQADAGLRSALADAVQRWTVENPIRAYFAADKLQPALDTRHTVPANVAAILLIASERGQAGQVAQHIVGAKLALRFPGEQIENYGYSTADVPKGRPGDFLIGSTVIHVAASASSPLIKKCRQNIRHGFRVVVLVPEGRRDGAAQLMASEKLGERVAVLAIETFVGQNIEELGTFEQGKLQQQLRALLETYNRRVSEAEPDPSLQIDIPSNLGK